MDNIASAVSRNVMNRINESLSDDLANREVSKFVGRRPKTVRARINRIYKKVHEYRIDSRLYKDDHWQCVDDYASVIESLGGELNIWCEGGGYCDRDKDGYPMSKVWNIERSYDDGMVISGYIKAMAAGSVNDPFDRYDTCIIMWPK